MSLPGPPHVYLIMPMTNASSPDATQYAPLPDAFPLNALLPDAFSLGAPLHDASPLGAPMSNASPLGAPLSGADALDVPCPFDTVRLNIGSHIIGSRHPSNGTSLDMIQDDSTPSGAITRSRTRCLRADLHDGLLASPLLLSHVGHIYTSNQLVEEPIFPPRIGN